MACGLHEIYIMQKKHCQFFLVFGLQKFTAGEDFNAYPLPLSDRGKRLSQAGEKGSALSL